MIGLETKLQDIRFVEHVKNLDGNLKAEILNCVVKDFNPLEGCVE